MYKHECNVLEYKDKNYEPSLTPKYTTRNNFHKVIAHENTYALTFRGYWKDTWREFRNGKFITLTHGSKEYNSPEEAIEAALLYTLQNLI